MALSNLQLERILQKHRPNFFLGVFSYDAFRVQYCPYFPIAIIINTHPIDQDGHWTCLYIDKYKNGIFFDSAGLAPYGKFYDFFKMHAKKKLLSAQIACN